MLIGECSLTSDQTDQINKIFLEYLQNIKEIKVWNNL
jgi:hypothetical protein